MEVLVFYHGIEAGALLDELVGGDLAVVVEVGTEIAVAEDDGTGEPGMKVGEEFE